MIKIPFTVSDEFKEFYEELQTNFKEFLAVDGIGDNQIDFRSFRKAFFEADQTADISVDANANVDAADAVSFGFECVKPMFRLDNYATMFDMLVKDHGVDKAKSLLRANILGQYYINDFSGDLAKPYSYHPDTLIQLDDCVITMKCLFDTYSKSKTIHYDREEISFHDKDIKVFDGNKFIKVLKVTQHISHCDLIKIETEKGSINIVTEDHPCITNNGLIDGKDLSLGLTLNHEPRSRNHEPRSRKVNKNNITNPDFAYIIGAMVGRGWVNDYHAGFSTNHVKTTHFFDKFKTLFSFINNIENHNNLVFDGMATRDMFDELIGDGGYGMNHLPKTFLNMTKDTKIAMISGIIDTIGDVNFKSGQVYIVTPSFELAQQIAMLIESIGYSQISTRLISSNKPYGSLVTPHKGVYAVSFIPNSDIRKYSVKVEKCKYLVLPSHKINELYESDSINKLEIMPYIGKYVYDITTKTGEFSTNGIHVHNCFNYSCIDIHYEGLSTVNKIKSVPPKHMMSFFKQLEQFIGIASNNTHGATGIADLLIVLSFYVKKALDDGNKDSNIQFDSEKDIWKYVEENLSSFVYTINQPLFRANQCVTEDTEVLTPDGWKGMNDLKVADDIYTWHDGSMNIQQVNKVNIHDYNGEMHIYEGRDYIQQVSPNHRVLLKKNNSDDYILKYSSDIIDSGVMPILPVAFPINDIGGVELSDEDIIKLAEVGEIPTILMSMNRNQAKLFIGSWSKYDNLLYCASNKIQDKLQHISVLAGYGSKHVGGYLSLYKKKNKSATQIFKVNYTGKIWCPTTDDGIVVFRKNGKVFISGNSPFTNVSVYDDVFLRSLASEYFFRDGSTPDVEIVKKLQKMFVNIKNNELDRTPVTFPVVTACFTRDDEGNIADKEFAEFIAEASCKYGAFEIYTGDTSTLSSCCFDGKQKTLTRSSNGINFLTFKELYDAGYEDTKKNFKIFHNGSWVAGKTVKVNSKGKKLYKVVTTNNKEILVTDDHPNPTINGDIKTSDLTTDDYLMFNEMELDNISEIDNHLTYSQGYFIGLYAGDGSRYKRKGTESYETTLSLNLNDGYDLLPIIKQAMDEWSIGAIVHTHETETGVLFVKIYSKLLFDITEFWVNGSYANEKSFNLDAIEQSIDFRKGIIDGWYKTDGGNSNRIYSVSDSLIETGEVIFTSLGVQTIIDTVDRTDEKGIIRGKEFNRNYPTHCIRWYSNGNKRGLKGVYIIKNNSKYFKIKNISLCDDIDKYVYCFEMKNENEPYFTLPNGIITHNCRLRSSTENQFFNSFGAGSSKIGSMGVVTVNLPRIAYNSTIVADLTCIDPLTDFLQTLSKIQDDVAILNDTKRKFIKKYIDTGALPLYTNGFMALNKQYSTMGINGLNEALEILGLDIMTSEGQSYVSNMLKQINKRCSLHEEMYKFPHNCEQTPSENSSIKLAVKDKMLGLNDHYKFYSNQLIPLIRNADMLDRIKLQGMFDKDFSGGSICHVNFGSRITTDEMLNIMNTCAKAGVVYWAPVYVYNICKNRHTSIGGHTTCPTCGEVVDKYTKVVGFLTKVDNWHKVRRDHDFNQRIRY